MKQDLLAEIEARPDDDAPRLALADWLEGNGDPARAELIRLQCAEPWLEYVPRDMHPSGYRASNLESSHGNRWLGDRPRPRGGVSWKFLRGLPEHVVFDSFKALEEHQEAVFRYPVRRVGFYNLRSVAKVAAWPGLARVRELDLKASHLRDEGLDRLLASPYLGGLTWLNLGGNRITAAGAEALARAPALANLRHLELGDAHGERNVLGTGGARALASSPHLRGLRYLGLRRADVGDAGVAALAGGFPGLTAIDLGNNGLGPLSAQRLVESEAWPELQALGLGLNLLKDEGLVWLARSGHWRRLRYLDLQSAAVGDEGVRELASAALLQGLALLHLGRNHVGDEGAVALARSERVGALRGLNVCNNLIGEEGGWELGRSPALAGLRSVSLYGNAISNQLRQALEKRFSTSDLAPLEELAKARAASAPAPREEAAPAASSDLADEDGLLQAILDDPDDPLARLVHADWLEEHDHADRAELIRRMYGPDAAGRPGAAQLDKFVQAALGPVYRLLDGASFDRGLVRVVTSMRAFQSRELQEQAPAAFRRAGVYSLRLRGTTKHWDRVAASPVLAAVRELIVEASSMNNASLAALLASPHLAGLESLHFDRGNYRLRIMRVLTDCTGLAKLRRLALGNIHPVVDELQAFAAWPQAANLRQLTLQSAWMDAADLAVLARSPNLAGLQALDLAVNHIGAPGAKVLATSPYLRRLTRLVLRYNSLPDAAAEALAGSEGLARLRLLDLTGNALSEAGAAALAGSPHLAALTELRVDRNRVGAPGLLSLVQSQHLGGLRKLVTDAGALLNAEARLAYERRFGPVRVRGE